MHFLPSLESLRASEEASKQGSHARKDLKGEKHLSGSLSLSRVLARIIQQWLFSSLQSKPFLMGAGEEDGEDAFDQYDGFIPDLLTAMGGDFVIMPPYDGKYGEPRSGRDGGGRRQWDGLVGMAQLGVSHHKESRWA